MPYPKLQFGDAAFAFTTTPGNSQWRAVPRGSPEYIRDEKRSLAGCERKMTSRGTIAAAGSEIPGYAKPPLPSEYLVRLRQENVDRQSIDKAALGLAAPLMAIGAFFTGYQALRIGRRRRLDGRQLRARASGRNRGQVLNPRFFHDLAPPAWPPAVHST